MKEIDREEFDDVKANWIRDPGRESAHGERDSRLVGSVQPDREETVPVRIDSFPFFS